MNAPPRPARPSELAGNRATDPLLLVCGVARRLFEGHWPCRFSFEANERFDGLIIADAAAAGEAERLLHEHRAWLAPIVDLTGERLGIADFTAAAATPASLRQGVEDALTVVEALLRLPASVLAAQDPETLLLARVYSRGGRLVPTYDGAAPQLLRYPQAGYLERPADMAERLTEAGWLSRTFFDRVHFCPSCQSSRLNAARNALPADLQSCRRHRSSITSHARTKRWSGNSSKGIKWCARNAVGSCDLSAWIMIDQVRQLSAARAARWMRTPPSASSALTAAAEAMPRSCPHEIGTPIR